MMTEEKAPLSSKLELLAKTGSFTAGFNEVYMLLLNGKLEGVIHVSKLPQTYLKMLKSAAELSKTPTLVYEGSRLSLGKALSLKHPVSVVGIVKQGESRILEELKKHVQ